MSAWDERENGSAVVHGRAKPPGSAAQKRKPNAATKAALQPLLAYGAAFGEHREGTRQRSRRWPVSRPWPTSSNARVNGHSPQQRHAG